MTLYAKKSIFLLLPFVTLTPASRSQKIVPHTKQVCSCGGINSWEACEHQKEPLCDIIATKKPKDVKEYLETLDSDSLLIPLTQEIYKSYVEKKGKLKASYLIRFYVGHTILQYAIRVGCDSSVIDLLLQYNWKLLTLNMWDNIKIDSLDPYHLTIHQEHTMRVSTIKVLLKHEERIKSRMELFIKNYSKLPSSINCIIIDYIINSTRVPVNTLIGFSCCEGHTPLQIAVNQSNNNGKDRDTIQISALLLPYDWNESIHQPLIYTNNHFVQSHIIHMAVWNGGHFKVIKALVKKNSEVLKERIKDQKSIYHDFTPLHMAVFRRHKKIVKFFLSYNKKLTYKDGEETLINATIKNNPGDFNHCTALQIAISRVFQDIKELFP